MRPRIADIPAAFLPRRLKHLNRNAGGSESVVVFRYGSDIERELRGGAGDFPALFCGRQRSRERNVEPRAEMGYDAYQAALHATREGWVNGEND